jgi:hypothetical protein
MWYPVRTHISVRQELQFKLTVRSSDSCGPDTHASKKEIADSTSTIRATAYHGPEVWITDMEIACCRIAVRKLIPHGPDAREPYKEITCNGRATVWMMCHPVRTMSLNRKDFSAKFLENLVAQLSVRTAHVHRPDAVQVYFA